MRVSIWRRCWWSAGGSTATRSGRPAHWATDPRHPRRDIDDLVHPANGHHGVRIHVQLPHYLPHELAVEVAGSCRLRAPTSIQCSQDRPCIPEEARLLTLGKAQVIAHHDGATGGLPVGTQQPLHFSMGQHVVHSDHLVHSACTSYLCGTTSASPDYGARPAGQDGDWQRVRRDSGVTDACQAGGLSRTPVTPNLSLGSTVLLGLSLPLHLTRGAGKSEGALWSWWSDMVSEAASRHVPLPATGRPGGP